MLGRWGKASTIPAVILSQQDPFQTQVRSQRVSQGPDLLHLLVSSAVCQQTTFHLSGNQENVGVHELMTDTNTLLYAAVIAVD